MRLLSVYFDTPETNDIYTRMVRVWEYSATKNGGADAVDVIRIEKPPEHDAPLFNANHAKLEVWRDYVREHDDDVVLMDADTIVLRSLRPAFAERSFDVAFTTRGRHGRYTINGGVVFVRNTEAAKSVLDTWYDADTLLHEDRALHQKYRSKYGGMNQASYGYMMDHHPPGKIIELPCEMWNQVEWWARNHPNPAVIHIKSQLRAAVFSKRPTAGIRHTMQKAVKAWRTLETDMLNDPVVVPRGESPPLQIVGVQFAAAGACDYKRLAAVWKYSAQKAHPHAKVKLLQIENPQGRTSHQRRNQHKLETWNNVVQKADCNTILMDVDMAVFRPIDDVFDAEFDICYTRRTKTRMPLNGGVLFVKPTDLAKSFFKAWQAQDLVVLRQRNRYQEWVRKYGGQNQASFGYMLERGGHPARIASVECTVYNCCNEEWGAINDETRVVHYKGALKRICSQSGGRRAHHPKYDAALAKWKALEREMKTGDNGDPVSTTVEETWQTTTKSEPRVAPKLRVRPPGAAREVPPKRRRR